MKTRMKKIIIVAAALLFLGSGVSFAHDWNDRSHKQRGHAYGHNKVKKNQSGWNNKHFRRSPHYSKRYVYKEVHHNQYYENHHRRPAAREDVIYKVALKDPNLVFKIVVKDHR